MTKIKTLTKTYATYIVHPVKGHLLQGYGSNLKQCIRVSENAYKNYAVVIADFDVDSGLPESLQLSYDVGCYHEETGFKELNVVYSREGNYKICSCCGSLYLQN